MTGDRPQTDAESPGDSKRSAEHFRRVEQYFWKAVEEPPETRLSWLRNQKLPSDIERQLLAAVKADLSSQDSSDDSYSADRNAALTATVTTGKDQLTSLTTERQLPSLKNYEILEEIDRGGMGIVYRARQLRPNRLVAIKMMRLGAFSSQLDVERFLNEANAASRLTHSAVVPVYEVGECSGEPFIVMKYINGDTLEQLLKKKQISTEDAVKLLLVVARAVADAHEHAIVHRDLKPSNVLVDRAMNSPWVLDFGLAKSLMTDEELTSAGDIMGTPGYMSPEQANGKSDSVTPAADVYGLGAILYRILTGRPPVESTNGDFAKTMQLVREHDVIPPRSRDKRISAELDAVCMKALETDSTARYQHARDFADDLCRCLEGESISARKANPARRLHRWSRRCPGLAATIAVLILFYTYHIVAMSIGLLQTGDTFQRAVNVVVLLALVNALVWQWCLRKTDGAAWTLYTWSTGEMGLLTAVIYLGDGAKSGLVPALFVLVAVSALRCRKLLIAYVTFLAVASYSFLWVETSVARTEGVGPLQAVPVILTILLIGLVQYLTLVRSSTSFEALGNSERRSDVGDPRRLR